MMRVGTNPVERQLGRRQVAAGSAALALSLGLHLVFFLLLAQTDFRFFPQTFLSLRDRLQHAFKMLDVTPPIPAEHAPQAQTPRGGEALGPSDLAGEVEAHAVRPSAEALQPPPAQEQWLAGAEGSLAGPGKLPDRGVWEARREILAIEDQKVADEISVLPRRRIPRIQRFQQAPDIVFEADRDELPAGGAELGGGEGRGLPLTRAEIAGKVIGRTAGEETARPRTVEPAGWEAELPGEDRTGAPSLKAMEKLLLAELSTYLPPEEPRFGFLKIEIRRIGADVLPVIPKDIVLVQDCSASIATQRLHFCKAGWQACLPMIQPGDRFNVMGFRDNAQTCFEEWREYGPEAAEQAQGFVAQMKSEGETDIFASTRKLLDMQRTPGRPMIAFVVTDGRPTTGLVRSSDIVNEFSRLNDGAISVFALGTVQTANLYLLDLLGYSNRGAGTVNKRGRWAIPEVMAQIMREIRRPVMADLRFRFATGSGCEVYPAQTENLYLDRTLVLYGRYPRTTTNVVFQAVGQAADVKCDMVFNLATAEAKAGNKDMRTNWARQKIYYLIAQYARRADPALLREIRSSAATYGVNVPYRDEL